MIPVHRLTRSVYHIRRPETTDVYPDISFALLKMGIYSVLVFCLLLLLYNLRKKAVVLILVFALFNIENIVIGFTNIRYSRNNAIVRKSRPVYDAMTPLLDIDEKYKTAKESGIIDDEPLDLEMI